jgi:hypothetical protein
MSKEPQTTEPETLAQKLEQVILRRLYEDRVHGYTIEMSKELVAVVKEHCNA